MSFGKRNTLSVIEHNLEVVRQTDYIIDLSPEDREVAGATGLSSAIITAVGFSFNANFATDPYRRGG